MPAGTITFLFTDIEGSTRLLQQLGTERYNELLIGHRRIIRTATKHHGGQEVDTQGDAFFISFTRATDAVSAVVEIQRSLASHVWPNQVELRVRMGLHTGEPLVAEEGYVGIDVNRAARVAHVGHGGQVLLSDVTAGLLKRNLPEGVRLKQLGEYQLKDLQSSWTMHQLIIADLPSDFPELKAERIILPPDSSPRKPITLPAFLQEDYIKLINQPQIFVARERELERLDKLKKLALSGQGQVAFVAGEAGSGKTSLLREFANLAQETQPDLIVAKGHCNAYSGVGEPYLPFREILEMLSGDVEAKRLAGAINQNHALRLWNILPEVAEALVNHGPDLIDSFIDGSHLLDRATLCAVENTFWLDRLKNLVTQRSNMSGNIMPEQNRIFDEYFNFLKTLASNQPVLLFLEDLHWADVSSISLLFHIGRRIPGCRILILGTYRPEDISSEPEANAHPLVNIINEFKRQFGDNKIDLDQNRPMDGRDFVNALLDNEPNRLGQHFRKELARRTGGHALFTVELLQDVKERGGLLQDEEGYWIEAPDLNWDVLPARVEGVIERRFGQLDTDLLQVLTIASVEGDEFTAETIAQVQGIDERQLVHMLSVELGKKHRLVSVQEVKCVENRRLSVYSFCHNLYQKYLYESLDETEKVYLHEDVGRALERLYSGKTYEIATILARHFSIAGITDKAIHYYLLAGEQAIKRSAFVEAIHLLSRGIELIHKLRTNRKLARQEIIFQSLLGSVYQATKGYAAEEAKQAFNCALEICDDWGFFSRKFPALLGLFGVHVGHLELSYALDVADQALDVAQKSGIKSFLTTGHVIVGMSNYFMGHLASSREHYEQAIEYYNPDQAWISGAFNPRVAFIGIAPVLHLLGYPEKAREWIATTITHLQNEDDIYSLTYTYFTNSQLCSLKRDYKETLKWAEATIELSTKYGFPYWRPLIRYMQGWAIAHMSSPEEGIKKIQQGISELELAGVGINPYGLAYLADAYRLAGQLDLSLATIHKAMVGIESTEERFFESELYRLKGELLLLARTDETEILKSYNRAIEITRQQGAKWLELRATTSLARLLKSQGKIKAARDQLLGIVGWFTEGFDMVDLRDAKELLQELFQNSQSGGMD